MILAERINLLGNIFYKSYRSIYYGMDKNEMLKI